MTSSAKNPASSTLIEFPSAGRASALSRPVWRQELSERVREIKQRRAKRVTGDEDHQETGIQEHDGDIDNQTPLMPKPASTPSSLGLVPPVNSPADLNPLVVAALRRIERARPQVSQQAHLPVSACSGGSGAATAMARVREEISEEEQNILEAPVIEAIVSSDIVAEIKAEQIREAEKPVESVKAVGLAVIPSTASQEPPAPRRIVADVIDDVWLEKRLVKHPEKPKSLTEKAFNPAVDVSKSGETKFAPFYSRVLSAIFDLLIVAFVTSPFVAIIELTIGSWSDTRILALIAGIAIAILFVYLTAAVALTGRTCGMWLFSLRIIDTRTGLLPSGSQAARRAVAFVFSLGALGLGIIYALVDSEGRALHDRLSGTGVLLEK